MKNLIRPRRRCVITIVCAEWPYRISLTGSCEKWQVLARFSAVRAVTKSLKPILYGGGLVCVRTTINGTTTESIKEE
jgi:hypothetical protein